jgi:hypothetical protein
MGDLLPLVAFDLVPLAGMMIPLTIFMIPIIAILTSHQRKMAEIIHAQPQVPTAEINALRQEVAELRQLVNQQAIALDGRQPIQSPPLAEQLKTY